jgi:acetate kinase
MVLDPKLNAQNKAQEGTISSSNSKVQVMVIPTNEELVVAREVKRFLTK